MDTISTAELKAHLGKYLRLVREGATVYVTAHRKPIAALAPSQAHDGVQIHPPTAPLARLRRVAGLRVASGADGVAELLRERRRR